MSMKPEYLVQLAGILNANKGKNFVQRILNPSAYPAIDNKDGSRSTHLMSYSEVDGRYVVYPKIHMVGGELKEMGDGDAMDYAMKSGEFIAFDNEDEAKWFSKDYKKYWEETGVAPVKPRPRSK
jgi:hypothetical protein